MREGKDGNKRFKEDYLAEGTAGSSKNSVDPHGCGVLK
jgi:hypothetical protein